MTVAGVVTTVPTVRHAVRIPADADTVWGIVGDPAALPSWWPGIVAAHVEGTTRTVTTATGITLPEELLVVDPLLRRITYRITAPLFRHHRSTLDVIDLGDGTSLAVYAVESDPAVMALVIGGAALAALEGVAAGTAAARGKG